MKSITLNTSQTETLEILKQHQSINTFELQNLAVVAPAQCIQKLKAKGVLIDVDLKPAVDRFGRRHTRIAHYTYKGWAE